MNWREDLKKLIDKSVSELLISLSHKTERYKLEILEKFYRAQEENEENLHDVLNNSFDKCSYFEVSSLENIPKDHVLFPEVIFKTPDNSRNLIKEIVGSFEIRNEKSPTYLLNSVDVGFSVAAMSIRNNFLYVLACESSTIRVYDSKQLSFVYSFDVENLCNPYDVEIIAAKLYITESETNELHVVDSGRETSKQIKIYKPFSTLSVTSMNRLLVTSFSNKLIEFCPTDFRWKRIFFPRECNHIYKVTQISKDCYVGIEEGCKNRIFLFDVQRNIVTSLDRPTPMDSKMNGLCYMVMDNNQVLYICDHENQRIVIFDVRLGFKGFIDLEYKPFRLCVDIISRRLFVSYIGSSEISVFKLI
ncbi:hypothetical protein HELRODRAFT_170779 [Helobdella robusta]|uniref:Uncharacterized protein n=1 Tax=Helobdella robusta TaxID=6412 RepID=T1F3F0_HELRO|nr:hypothetical protein HELRODRAFT_170779 [Helobdella robusta]ESO06766.1 hypothetical protein HELRODRAFT_170779 [Helobdella robusta]